MRIYQLLIKLNAFKSDTVLRTINVFYLVDTVWNCSVHLKISKNIQIETAFESGLKYFTYMFSIQFSFHNSIERYTHMLTDMFRLETNDAATGIAVISYLLPWFYFWLSDAYENRSRTICYLVGYTAGNAYSSTSVKDSTLSRKYISLFAKNTKVLYQITYNITNRLMVRLEQDLGSH